MELIHPSEFFTPGERTRFGVRNTGEHGVKATIRGVPVEITRKPAQGKELQGWHGTIGGRSFAIYPYNGPGNHNGYLALPTQLTRILNRHADQDRRSPRFTTFSIENSQSFNPVSKERIEGHSFHGYSTDHYDWPKSAQSPRGVFKTLFQSAQRVEGAEKILREAGEKRAELERIHSDLAAINAAIRKKYNVAKEILKLR